MCIYIRVCVCVCVCVCVRVCIPTNTYQQIIQTVHPTNPTYPTNLQSYTPTSVQPCPFTHNPTYPTNLQSYTPTSVQPCPFTHISTTLPYTLYNKTNG